MIARYSTTLVLAALSIGCATSPPAATPAPVDPPATQAPPPPTTSVVPSSAVNPVGTFEYTATLPDGSQTSGLFTITGSAGSYTGTISSQNAGETPLTNISVDGQTLMFRTVIPDGTVDMTLTFTGSDFAGKWAVQGAEGPVTGRRR